MLKNICFFLSINKLLIKLEKQEKKMIRLMSFKMKLIFSTRFMQSPLSGLMDNLTGELFKECGDCRIKCKKCENIHNKHYEYIEI